MSSQAISLPPLASNLSDPSSGGQVQYTFNSKVMVAAMLILCIVVLFVVSLHVYAKWFWRQRGAALPLSNAHNVPWRRHRGLPVEGIDESLVPTICVGLDSATISSLPTFIYQASKHRRDGNMTELLLECAVCLSEFQAYEKGRFLPNCKHSFHIGCIDMWFRSHSTCPLCRAPVSQWTPQHHVQNPPAQSNSTPPFAQSLPATPPEQLTFHLPLQNSSSHATNRYPSEPSTAFTPPLLLLQCNAGIQAQVQHQESLAKNDELLCRYDSHMEFRASVRSNDSTCGPSSTGSMPIEIQLGQAESGASIARCQSLGMPIRWQSEDREACSSQPIKSRSFRMSIKWLLSRDLSRGRGRIFPSAGAEQSSVSNSLPLRQEER